MRSNFILKICLALFLIAIGADSGKCQNMEWLSHPGEYSRIEYAGGDLFRVKNHNGKWGLLHSNGQLTMPVVYDSITPFIENRALLLDRPSKRLLGIINTKGDLIKDFSSDKVFISKFPQYKEGRLAYGTEEGFYGYLNENGGVAIEPRFYLAAPFQDGVAAVQYDNTEYGLIRKDGRSAIISDDRYYFMSSPVGGKVLVTRGTRKGGDQLVLMRIDGTSLKKDKVLEDGMNINLSDDFSSLECQLGHSYYLDDQWRIKSASYAAPLPQIWEDTYGMIPEDSSELNVLSSADGSKIAYHEKPIVNNKFNKVKTYDKKFAIVQTKDSKLGVLKLNPQASIGINPSEEPLIFHHNALKDAKFGVSLKNLDPSKLKFYCENEDGSISECSLIKINGELRLQIPYFKSASKYDDETSEEIGIFTFYDDLDWKYETVSIGSKHQPGYTVNLTGPGTTSENGTATLTLHVKATNGNDNINGTVTVNGGKPISFNKGTKTIPLNVSVPEGSAKTFSYNVKVKEEGCPDYTTTLSKSISNPVRTVPETNENGKKKIIIQ